MRRTNTNITENRYQTLFAIKDHTATNNDQLSFKIGEKFKRSEIRRKDDYIYVTSLKTNKSGYVPVNLVASKEINLEKFGKHSDSFCEKPNNIHQFIEDFSIKPLLCQSCKEFIWGYKEIHNKCKKCFERFHLLCTDRSISIKCSDNSNNYNIDDYKIEVIKWSTQDVLYWLNSANFSLLYAIFYEKQVTGNLLPCITDKFMNSFLNISDPFVKKNLKDSIEALFLPKMKNPLASKVLKGKDEHLFFFGTSSETVYCFVCNFKLYGMIRQGVFCSNCGIFCHKMCVYKATKNCPLKSSTDFNRHYLLCANESSTQSRKESSIHILRKLLGAIENSKYTNKIYYKSTYISYKFYELREILNIDDKSKNLELNSEEDTKAAINVLECFFAETSSSIITSTTIDYLVSNKEMESYMSKMSKFKMLLIKYICGHYSKMTLRSDDIEYQINLLEFIGKLLVKSTKIDSNKISYDAYTYKAVMDKLHFYFYEENLNDNNIKLNYSDFEMLEMQEWFWNDIPRERTCRVLSNKKDGSFLVRVSTDNIKYTLAVVYNSKVKMMHIKQSNGFYGLETLYRFKSILELVEYYQIAPLEEFNSKLSTRLLYPISKQDFLLFEKLNDLSSLKNCLEEEIKTYELLNDEIIILKRDYDRLDASFILESVFLNSYQSQINLNYRNLSLLITELEEFKQKSIFENLEALQNKWMKVYLKLHLIQKEKNKLTDCIDKLSIKLKHSKGILVQLEELISSFQKKETTDLPPINPKCYMAGSLNKDEINRLLKKQSDGTFIVRESMNIPGLYVLSVTFMGNIFSIRILESNKTYSLSEDNRYFTTIESLVEYYRSISLSEFNVELETTLNTPALQ